MEGTKEDNDFLLRQLVKLGDMMGDGLHHEPDGRWIEREYKQICKALYPEMYKQKRIINTSAIDKQIKALIDKFKCNCGGTLKQSRKGSKVCYCQQCNKRYVGKSSRNNATK